MTVRTITKQEYENSHISPSGLVFFENEKDLCEIVSMHCAENIKQNILILEKLLKINMENAEFIEITNNQSTLYIKKPIAQHRI